MLKVKKYYIQKLDNNLKNKDEFRRFEIKFIIQMEIL